MTDSRRLAILLRALDGGGIQRSALTLAAGFVERGFAVDLLVADANGPMRAQVPDGIHLIQLRATPHLAPTAWPLLADPKGASAFWPLLAGPSPMLVRRLPALTAYLRRRAPLGLLALGTQANLAALWARRLAHAATRVVVSERNVMSEATRLARRRFRRAYPRIARRMFPRAEGVVAISDAVAADLAIHVGLAPELITTIHNPAVRPQLEAAAHAPLDHPWFAPGAPPVVLAVGRLHWQKDFSTLLRAFAQVRAARPARLVVLGEGPERARLEALAGSLGSASNVALPGFAPNPYAWMARAAVLVLSSVTEGFGNVLCEAMACGCPVIATDCPGGPREILADGTFGRLVPVGDAAAMARAILDTLEQPSDAERLRARAACFTMDRAVERYLDLLLGGQAHG